MTPLRVLVVDDEKSLATAVARILRKAGYESESAFDGREALRMLEESRFDLMLTDLFMPEKEGIETIREARQRFPQLRIVAMSGGCPGMDARSLLAVARALGAAATLRKPASAREYIDALRAATEG